MRKRDRVLTKIGIWRTRFPSIMALTAALALIVISWGVWKLLDAFLFPNMPLLGAVIAILAGILILYVEDTHLRE